jgi:hypothetical protein
LELSEWFLFAVANKAFVLMVFTAESSRIRGKEERRVAKRHQTADNITSKTSLGDGVFIKRHATRKRSQFVDAVELDAGYMSTGIRKGD